MKKTFKPALLLALAAALILGLAACDRPTPLDDEPSDKTVDAATLVDDGNLTDAESVDATMTLEMAYNMPLGETGTDGSDEPLTMSMTINAELAMQSDGDVSHVNGPMTVAMEGTSIDYDMDAWQVNKNGKTVTYTRESEDAEWMTDDTAGALVSIPEFKSSMLTDLKLTTYEDSNTYSVTGNLDTSQTDIGSLTGIMSGLGVNAGPVTNTLPVTLTYNIDTQKLSGFSFALEDGGTAELAAFRVNYVINSVNETTLELPDDIPA